MLEPDPMPRRRALGNAALFLFWLFNLVMLLVVTLSAIGWMLASSDGDMMERFRLIYPDSVLADGSLTIWLVIGGLFVFWGVGAIALYILVYVTRPLRD